MEQAIQAYRHTAVSSEFKEIERLRSKARHDEASALRNERIEIAQNAKNMGMDTDTIIKLTGLPREKIEELK